MEINGFIVCFFFVNGIVGIKFIVGLLSCDGIIFIFFMQDMFGLMVCIVIDVVIVLGVMIGVDKVDVKIIVSEG